MVAAGLDKIHRRQTIDSQIALRIAHAVTVTDLTRQMENVVTIAHQDVRRIDIPHVGNVDREMVDNWFDVL